MIRLFGRALRRADLPFAVSEGFSKHPKIVIKRALKFRPNDGYILDSLGWAYFRLGELQQAVDALEKAIELEPEDPTIHEHLGDVYLAFQKPQMALDYYKKSLALTDKDEDKARVTAKIEAIKP